MAAHRHQDGQKSGRHNPPFLAPFIQEQTQHKEEYGSGTHIHRTGREGLRAPVERQVLGGFLEVFLSGALEKLDGFRLVGVHGARGGAAVEVGNHQVGKLFPAIAPGGGVIQVQPLLAAAFPGELGAAAHGIGRIFGQRQQLVGIGGHARQAQHQKKGRGNEELLHRLPPDCRHQLHNGIDEHHQGQVIGNLLVVGLDLEAQRKAEKDGPQQDFPNAFGLVRVNQGGQNPGHQGDGLHLGIVAHLDNLEVIAAERHGNGAHKGHRPADSQRQHQQEGAQQRYKEPGGRTLAGKQQVVQRLGIVSAVLGRNGRGGHSAEHRVGPVRGVVGVGLVPLRHLVRHSHIAGDVALVHNLAFQHLRHKAVTQRQEQRHNPQGEDYFLPNIFHFAVLFRSSASAWAVARRE